MRSPDTGLYPPPPTHSFRARLTCVANTSSFVHNRCRLMFHSLASDFSVFGWDLCLLPPRLSHSDRRVLLPRRRQASIRKAPELPYYSRGNLLKDGPQAAAAAAALHRLGSHPACDFLVLREVFRRFLFCLSLFYIPFYWRGFFPHFLKYRPCRRDGCSQISPPSSARRSRQVVRRHQDLRRDT